MGLELSAHVQVVSPLLSYGDNTQCLLNEDTFQNKTTTWSPVTNVSNLTASLAGAGTSYGQPPPASMVCLLQLCLLFEPHTLSLGKPGPHVQLPGHGRYHSEQHRMLGLETPARHTAQPKDPGHDLLET